MAKLNSTLNEIKSLHKRGLTVAEIAKELDLKVPTVYGYSHRLKLKANKKLKFPTSKKISKDQIIELASNFGKVSLRVQAKQYGISHEYVRNLAHKVEAYYDSK